VQRRTLAWVGLAVGLVVLAAVPAWWLASRPDTSAGSLAPLGSPPAPAVDEPQETLAPGLPELPGTGAPVPLAPGSRLGLPSAEPDRVGVRSALLEDLQRPKAARPISLRIPALGVDAPVTPVGVDAATREVLVPEDSATVGWYRHGPSPGQPGSAVLAGHVDYGEGRAVFYRLGKLEPGAVVVVGFGDGSERRFRVVARRLYGEDDLPARVFAVSGRPVLTLITCGGSYDASARSYEGNVVVYAVPVGAREA
jgi:sortase (surface protein transpeptidase)